MTEQQLQAASELEAYLLRCIEEQREASVSMPTGCGSHDILATALNGLIQKGKRVAYCSPIMTLRDQMLYKVGCRIALHFPVIPPNKAGELNLDLAVYESWTNIPASLARSTVRYR